MNTLPIFIAIIGMLVQLGATVSPFSVMSGERLAHVARDALLALREPSHFVRAKRSEALAKRDEEICPARTCAAKSGACNQNTKCIGSLNVTCAYSTNEDDVYSGTCQTPPPEAPTTCEYNVSVSSDYFFTWCGRDASPYRDYQCHPDGSCKPLSVAGEFCDEAGSWAVECAEGLRCLNLDKDNSCQENEQTAGVCSGPLAVGADCTCYAHSDTVYMPSDSTPYAKSAWWDAGVYCESSDMKIAAQKAAGADCEKGIECLGSSTVPSTAWCINGKCGSTFVALGGECGNSQDCADGACDKSQSPPICVAYAADGTNCTFENNLCGNGNECDYFTYKCTRVASASAGSEGSSSSSDLATYFSLAADAPCNITLQCLPGLFCNTGAETSNADGVCQTPPAGAPAECTVAYETSTEYGVCGCFPHHGGLRWAAVADIFPAMCNNANVLKLVACGFVQDNSTCSLDKPAACSEECIDELYKYYECYNHYRYNGDSTCVELAVAEEKERLADAGLDISSAARAGAQPIYCFFALLLIVQFVL